MSSDRVRNIRIGIGVVVVIAAAVILALTVFGGDDEDDSASAAEPIGLSEADLTAKAPSFSHVAYWVGPQPSTSEYELTQTPDGRIYVRYLTEGADVGDQNPSYLTVGTYALPDARDALVTAEQQGGTEGLSEKDGYALLKGGNGLNAYVVFDDQPDLQIEIFSPIPGQAVELAKSGALTPLG